MLLVFGLAGLAVLACVGLALKAYIDPYSF